MKPRQFLSLVLAALPVQDAIAADVEFLHPPAGEQTSLSRVTTDVGGKLYLSWVSSTGTRSALYYASLTNSEWSDATLIGEGKEWFVNWADFPFLSVNDTGMAANWLQKSSGGTYDYDVVATFYSSASARWSEPEIIHSDGVSAEHGFVSMLPMGNGRTFISWLDGRYSRQESTHSDTHASGAHDSGGMTLRAGFFSGEGEKTAVWELDDLVCDCCQTSSAMTGSGPVVVYRNRTTKEVRDTYITRLVDGQWSAPSAVHHDNWQIDGCPVNGPSVSSGGSLTVVAWFTAKNDYPKVNFALSQNDGETFGAPVIVAEETTSGRISLAVLDSGGFAISWLETHGARGTLKLARYDQRGSLIESLGIAETKSSRRSGFPVITSHNNDVYVTWTDVQGKPQVRVAKVRF